MNYMLEDEPSTRPANFLADWGQMFRGSTQQPASIYSVPLSGVVSGENNYRNEYEGPVYEDFLKDTMVEQNHTSMDDAPLGTHGPPESSLGMTAKQNEAPKVPIDLVDTLSRDLNERAQRIRDHFWKQNMRNVDMQKSLEAMANDYNRIQELEQRLATLQQKLNILSEETERIPMEQK
ncbi:hypothetical protein N7478_000762 [Penicillium angulare]|uniref:uncharacterized protein n=1 Tax=Penicillium angulare TaxID=116970 RepID=UPI002540B0CC|nr:uncharacterized protein N7478_000762 [Penicillium angulare]KAJ5291511.1 hypothetical protein N7478_000762 [Penicillium angulare]